MEISQLHRISLMPFPKSGDHKQPLTGRCSNFYKTNRDAVKQILAKCGDWLVDRFDLQAAGYVLGRLA